MTGILNITNGDSTVSLMQEAGITGVFLAWRDIVHVGPVPQGLALEALCEVRAQYIFEQGWGGHAEVRSSFAERDEVLRFYRTFDIIILWFEHDLYDQLQILQILNWFAVQQQAHAALSMICTDQYLGLCSTDDIKGLLVHEKPVTAQQLALAKDAWGEFCSPMPMPQRRLALLNTDTSALPFLHGAVLRMLEEYPRCGNGLSRVASQALQIVASCNLDDQDQDQDQDHGQVGAGIGPRILPSRLFARYQETEQGKFLGDSTFWAVLNEYWDAPSPYSSCLPVRPLRLPARAPQALMITATGEAVLAGTMNWLACTGLAHWIGGVHLTVERAWRWDSESQSLRTVVGR
jgi:hypothetical protein